MQPIGTLEEVGHVEAIFSRLLAKPLPGGPDGNVKHAERCAVMTQECIADDSGACR
jgi:hypothetical protein